MSVQEIQKMYDNLYSTRYNDLVKTKNSALSDLSKQEAENKETFYNQRNQAAVTNANDKRSIRDYMARHNLLQSGESVDALLRNNTDYANSMGSINANESKFKNEIMNSRNKINAEFEGDKNALRAEIEAQKIKDILAYNEKQAEIARQQAAAAAAAAARSSTSSGSYTKAQAKQDLRYEYAYALRSGDYNQLAAVGGAMKEAYGNGYLTQKEYNDYMNGINNSISSLKRNEVKVNNGTYGYSTAPRTNATVWKKKS